MTVRRLRAASVLAALSVAAAFAGCGEAPADPEPLRAQDAVRAAERSLDERRAGDIDFGLTASTPSTKPVGFEVDGPYAFDDDHPLAVVDLTHRHVLGDESIESRIVSTGTDAWAVVDGKTTRLSDVQRRPLQLQGSRASAVPAVDLDAWLRDGKVDVDGDATVVTGEVEAAAFVRDLQRLAAQAGGRAAGGLDDELEARIAESVQSSEMRVELQGDGDDLVFRSLRATVEFGRSVPAALREALGDYAGATMELTLDVEDVATPLEVDAPSGG